VIIRTPITFLGMARAREAAEVDRFLTDPGVVEAVQGIRGASGDAERLAAARQLMERLG
jgi:hypothetical protein